MAFRSFILVALVLGSLTALATDPLAGSSRASTGAI
jgi:hypothetical protein